MSAVTCCHQRILLLRTATIIPIRLCVMSLMTLMMMFSLLESLKDAANVVVQYLLILLDFLFYEQFLELLGKLSLLHAMLLLFHVAGELLALSFFFFLFCPLRHWLWRVVTTTNRLVGLLLLGVIMMLLLLLLVM
jgi:hypothetical protein